MNTGIRPTEFVSKYLAVIKQNGLAVNNLYYIEMSLPNSLMYPGNLGTLEYNLQSDESKQIMNNSATSGIFDPNRYTTGVGNIIDSVTGITGQPTNNQYKNQSSSTNFNSLTKLPLLCVQAELPFYKQKTQNTFVNNMTHKFATGLDTDPIVLSFYVDRDNTIAEIFSRWQLLINNYDALNNNVYDERYRKTEGFMSYKNQYEAKELRINGINRTQSGLEPYFTASLIGAFPVSIKSFNFDNGVTALVKIDITFEYDKIRHYSRKIENKESSFPTSEALTGFNVIDAKNKINETINKGKELLNTATSDFKSVTGNLSGIASGAILNKTPINEYTKATINASKSGINKVQSVIRPSTAPQVQSVTTIVR